MGQIFQRPLPFSDLPPLTSTSPNNAPIFVAPSNPTIGKDPSTTNILDGFSGKKLSWEKHATLFPKHRFGAIGEFFSKFTYQKPQLPNNPPPKPNPFFQGYGSMGQKFSPPNTPDTATQTNFSAKDWNDSGLNESQYIDAATPSKYTLFKFANLNQGEKGISATGSCSFCDNALTANTATVAKKSLFNLAREQLAESISFQTNHSMGQTFGLPNTQDTATRTNVIAPETSKQMTIPILSHNSRAATSPHQVPETNKSWDNNLALSPIKRVAKLFLQTGKNLGGVVTFSARKLGLLSTQAPTNNSSAEEMSPSIYPWDNIDGYGEKSAQTSTNSKQLSNLNDGTGEPCSNQASTWLRSAKEVLIIAIKGRGGAVSENLIDLETGIPFPTTAVPPPTDKRGWVQWGVEGVAGMGGWAVKRTAANTFKFNWWLCKGAVLKLIPDDWFQAGGKISAGIDKIPPGLRIPAVAFASLALIGAYSYFRRSKATEPTDDDIQENFSLARRHGESTEPEPSRFQYQVSAQLAQLQSQIEQMRREKAALPSPAPVVIPESKPQVPTVIINKNRKIRYYNSPPPEAVAKKPAKALPKNTKPAETSVSLDVDYYNSDGKEDSAASSSNQHRLTNNQEALHV
jgi:hypothetical protein